MKPRNPVLKVEYPEMTESLNLQWLILNVKCLLPPGTWARQPSPETSGFGWSWLKQMGRRMAPWGEEDLFHLPQELWTVCAAEPDAGGLKYLTSQPSQYHHETQSCSYGDIFIFSQSAGLTVILIFATQLLSWRLANICFSQRWQIESL